MLTATNLRTCRPTGNAAGTLSSLVRTPGAVALLGFEGILYVVHLAVVFGLGAGMLRLPLSHLLVASNANIGNPATASSLATSKGWHEYVVPALIVGNVGQAVGTGLGLAFGLMMQ